MRARTGVAVTLIGILCLAALAMPATGQGKFQIEGADTVKSILERQTGHAVKLRLQSGEEVGGTVTKVGEHVVHLSELAGREFFDAVVRLDAINAVVLRTRGN